MNTIGEVTIQSRASAQSIPVPSSHSVIKSSPSPVEGGSAEPTVTESVKVTLSLEGLKAAASSKSSDVIASNAQAKRVEKIREQIKELQEKIREQQAELQSIQTSKGLSADQKVQRISAVSQQLAGLNSALAGMSAQLMEALKGQNQAAGGEGVQPLPFVRHDATPSTNA